MIARRVMAEHRFEDRRALAEALGDEVAGALREGVTERGAASLVVSGGSTPLPFFEVLRSCRLRWSAVTVTLADDRWVPVEHERSNEGLVRRELLLGEAAAAHLVGLVSGCSSPEEGITRSEQRLRDIPRPFDVVVLGMGADGHTASLFPGARETPAGLDLDSAALCLAVHPGGGLEPRVSLTLAALVGARRLFLHITGEEKWRVYREAVGPGGEKLPVGALLRAAPEKIAVYWSP